MEDNKRYVVCVKNSGYEESLEVRKIYELLADPLAESRGFIRVVDEDEDYLYPRDWFVPIHVPRDLESAWAQPASEIVTP
jgi:hypothetical protein